MTLDPRWKNPQGKENEQLYLWAQDLVKELRKGTVVGRGPPATKTADFTLRPDENFIINNKAGSACVVTLPNAAAYPSREIMVVNQQAQQLNSASANVVPLGGGAAGTAILSANAGRWATLVSDGTNWVIVAGVI